MNSLVWSMLFIGMAIGLLGSVLMCWKTFKDEEKSIKDNYQFIKKWADLTDEQYKNFESYFEKRINLLHDTVVNLCDINSQLASDNKENMENIVDYSRRMHELLDKIRDYIESSDDVNDERWNLIHDYIVNYEPINYKEDNFNEHENLGAEDGTPESGYSGDQAAEQAPVVSGEEDAVLVRGELEEDGLDASSEAEEV